jgi:cytosine/adenosine deaminase-related metal-dependent hydrolase
VAQPRTDSYPPMPLRRRVLVLLLAVATALVIVSMLLLRPGDPKHEALRAAREKPAQAAGGAASGVGGKADVLLLPPSASAPR